MGSISEIISVLEYGRSELLKATDGLSQRELTETPIYGDWTIKDVLGHVIGWDQRTIKILPLMLQNRAGEIAGVEVEEHNRHSVSAWRDKSLTEVMTELELAHQQILGLLSSIDHVEIDMRRERNGRVVTIRSYVIDVMVEHQRQHAAEIREWRQELEETIDPAAIKLMLAQNVADFMNSLDQLSDSEVLKKNTVGEWSISDLVGHIADWELRMLKSARHIFDPSLPEVLPVSDRSDDWNVIMVAKRADKTWPENHHDLLETQTMTKEFLAGLKPGDWRLRGPYPWPDDQGTLAELIIQIAEHYIDHLPDLKR
jgi:uncharacterized damage-inducible protein DinB